MSTRRPKAMVEDTRVVSLAAPRQRTFLVFARDDEAPGATATGLPATTGVDVVEMEAWVVCRDGAVRPAATGREGLEADFAQFPSYLGLVTADEVVAVQGLPAWVTDAAKLFREHKIIPFQVKTPAPDDGAAT